LVEYQNVRREGLFTSNTPPGHNVSSLQALGRPCPDSSTNTWKLLALPRKAMPVGIFSPEAKTEALNPGGKLMDGGNFGLKFAVLFMHWGEVEGLLTTLFAAMAIFGNASSGAKLHATATEDKLLNFKVIVLPFPIAQDKGSVCVESPNLNVQSWAGREWTGADDQAPDTPLHLLPF
jgi:hypothetical protein